MRQKIFECREFGKKILKFSGFDRKLNSSMNCQKNYMDIRIISWDKNKIRIGKKVKQQKKIVWAFKKCFIVFYIRNKH